MPPTVRRPVRTRSQHDNDDLNRSTSPSDARSHGGGAGDQVVDQPQGHQVQEHRIECAESIVRRRLSSEPFRSRIGRLRTLSSSSGLVTVIVIVTFVFIIRCTRTAWPRYHACTFVAAASALSAAVLSAPPASFEPASMPVLIPVVTTLAALVSARKGDDGDVDSLSSPPPSACTSELPTG